MTKINVTDVDFSDIRDSLKSFLESQSTFTDYDFEGSGLSVLLDILAANTHFQAYYANMAFNEAFLDSAVTRNAVVSHAKKLGYTPESRTASKAVIDLTLTPSSGTKATTVPKGTVFTADLDDETYNFVTLKEYTINSDSVSDMDIYEGRLMTFTYVVDTQNPEQRFVIPAEGVDTEHLKVEVQNSPSDTTKKVYTKAGDYNKIDSDSTVYFLQETHNGQYEIYFGDGVVGNKLDDENLVIIEYLVTNGEVTNGLGKSDKASSRTFTLSDSLNGYSGGEATVKSAAAGGAEQEDVDSIKFLAPRNYQAQNRAVTQQDFITALLEEHTDIESVYVWGGEDADPPEYGKVFISIKPKSGEVISDTEKEDIITDLENNKVIVSVTPQIVDPDYTYIIPTVLIEYDTSLTNKTADTLRDEVKTVIDDYGDNDLEKFDKDFYYSKLIHEIDETDDGIVNNLTSIKIQKRVEVELNNEKDYDLLFENAVYHPHSGHIPVVSSNRFKYYNPDTGENNTARLDDDGEGNIRIYTFDVTGKKTFIDEEAGTIDYKKGKITLQKFEPVSIVNHDELRVTVVPKKDNVNTVRNQILTIDNDDISVSADQV